MSAVPSPRPLTIEEVAEAYHRPVSFVRAWIDSGRLPVIRLSPRTIRVAWHDEKVRTLAGITDVRLHDLRHSFATFAVENGASLFQVGRALGHAKSVSTERYAHPTDAGARAIASDVAARFVPPSAPPANDEGPADGVQADLFGAPGAAAATARAGG